MFPARTINWDRTRAASLGLALGLLAASAANADTISQTLDFTVNSNAVTDALAFAAFDPSLGSLQSVALDFTATRRHDWAMWNVSGTTRDVTYDASLSGTALSLGGEALDFPDLSYGPGTASQLGSVSFFTAASAFLAGRSAFLGGAVPAFPSAFHPAENDTTITGDLILPTPDGQLTPTIDPGVLNVSFNPGIWQLQASNIFAGSLVAIQGNATLTYTFAPVRAPESGMPLSLLTVVLAVVLTAGHRRTAQAAE